MSSTRRTVIKNVSSNLFLQAVSMVGGFVLPPLIVLHYGSEINGMIASIRQFVSYLTLLEAGIGAAGVVALYGPLSRHAVVLRNRILASLKRLYYISGGVFVIGLLLLAVFYAVLTRHQVSPQTAFWMVLVLGSINVMDFFLFGTYRALLTADCKTYVISLVQAAAVAANVLVSYALIKNGQPVLTVLAVSSAVQLCKFLVYNAYVYRHYRDLRVKDEKQEVFHIRQRWDALVHQICALVIFGSPLILITVFLSLKDASIYAVYALVFSAVKMSLQAFSQGMQAVFGNKLQQDMAATRLFYYRYEQAYFCILGWAYSCTALLFLPFIAIYTRHMTDAPYYQPLLAWCFLAVAVVENIRIPAVTMIMAAGHYRETRVPAILEATINLVCSAVFIRYWGMPGLLAGAFVSFFFRSSEMISYSARAILGLKRLKSFVNVAVLFALMSVCIAAGRLITGHYAVSGYGGWVVLAAATAAATAFPFAVLYRILMNMKSARL